jgi:YcaO-like protein with predicted kinase domain
LSDWAGALAAAFDASLDEAAMSNGPRDSLRSRSPAAVLEQLEVTANALKISRLLDLTPLDTVGLCVFSAVVPNAVTDCYANGKGPDRDTALVSALMEAYELHAISQPISTRALYAKTVAEVEARAGASVIDPNTLPLPVIQRFAADTRFDWLPVLELGARKEFYLPADLFSFAYGNGPFAQSAGAFATSSGKSAGSSAFDALLHALLELVERDAFVMSQFEPQRAIHAQDADLGSDAAALIKRLGALAIEAYLFELTTDLGIPVVKACLAEPSGFGKFHIHKGISAHVDRPLAIYRALLEACQVRLTYFVGSREDVADGPAAESQLEALRAHHQSAPKADDALPSARRDLRHAIDAVLAALRGIGCDRVYVANLSDPRIGLPALSCYVPHLEGLYPGELGFRLDRRGEAARVRWRARGGTQGLAY